MPEKKVINSKKRDAKRKKEIFFYSDANKEHLERKNKEQLFYH